MFRTSKLVKKLLMVVWELIALILQDMFCDQKRQIQNLTARLEQVLKEKRSYEEKSSHLQQVCKS